MQKIKKCIIPAAGMGTRFLPATKALPKEMFPIVDKPVMQYLVEEAVNAGCEDIIIITGRNKRAIEDHFDGNFELEYSLERDGKIEILENIKKINTLANISYIRQPYPRGDGDAILRAKNLIKDEAVLVLFGDDLIFGDVSASKQLMEVYSQTGLSNVATIQVSDEEVSSYGIVEGNSAGAGFVNIEKFLEKPTPIQTSSRLAAIGKYIITPDVIDTLDIISSNQPNGEIKLADAFSRYITSGGKIQGIQVIGERFDAGSKAGFIKATLYQALHMPELREDIIQMIKHYL